MFSGRFQGAKKNAFSRLLDRKRKADLIDLTVSNPTQVGLAYPEKEILAALADVSNLSYDPNPAGSSRAREAVCGYYHQRGQAVDPEDVLLTCSTSEAYAYLFKLLCNPGDSIATPAPSYPLFEFLSTVESVDCSEYRIAYQADQWKLDLESLPAALSDTTRAVVAVHPNNPTGNFLDQEELQSMAATCRRNSHALILDEVFWDYGLSVLHPPDVLAETGTPAFVLNGISKLLGLPQLKLGWIVVRGPKVFKKQARQRLELIADTFLSVSSPVQHALPHLMKLRDPIQEQIRQRLRNNLETLVREIAGSAISVLPVEGGWTAILRLPSVLDDEGWVLQLLERHNVVVHPGYFYGIPDSAHLVLSLLPVEVVFREGVRRIVLLSREVIES